MEREVAGLARGADKASVQAWACGQPVRGDEQDGSDGHLDPATPCHRVAVLG
jgi:hypothetical protein